jgi:hypothetical protein
LCHCWDDRWPCIASFNCFCSCYFRILVIAMDPILVTLSFNDLWS